jgi:hypothetical protein
MSMNRCWECRLCPQLTVVPNIRIEDFDQNIGGKSDFKYNGNSVRRSNDRDYKLPGGCCQTHISVTKFGPLGRRVPNRCQAKCANFSDG